MALLKNRPLFIYWGRRGAVSLLALELAKALGDRAVFSVSRQNELFDQFGATGAPLLPVDTFHHGVQAILGLPRIISIRRHLREAIAGHGVGCVVVLMPHVWTPLIASAVRAAGARYIVVIHDAERHPGDVTALATRWLHEDALRADGVATLSRHVADVMLARYPALAGKVRVLFHPVVPAAGRPAPSHTDGSVGFLFLGRIMAYKGLPVFVEACERLRARNGHFRIGIVGEGALGDAEARLRALGATIVNRWVAHEEIATLAADYDAVVTSHIEASQSGAIPVANGLGLPSLTTPVGGLPEQVEDGVSGLIARDASAAAVAEMMERYLTDAALRARLAVGVRDFAERHSLTQFVAKLLTV